MPGRTNTKFTRIYINKIISDLFLIILQVMICTGVSVSFIIGTVITWRALALSGNSMIKQRRFNCYKKIARNMVKLENICERVNMKGLTYRVLAGLIPCAIVLLGLFLIPESPRWLVRN